MTPLEDRLLPTLRPYAAGLTLATFAKALRISTRKLKPFLEVALASGAIELEGELYKPAPDLRLEAPPGMKRFAVFQLKSDGSPYAMAYNAPVQSLGEGLKKLQDTRSRSTDPNRYVLLDLVTRARYRPRTLP